MRYGSVLKLTREDTPESIDRCFAQMKACGMNTGVIWPAAFWWEEKTEEYPFATGKRVLALAEKNGLGVIMELAGQLSVMEYIPDFLMKEEYHPVDRDGHREFGQSSFGFLNYFHPEVKEQICNHFRAAALAYRDCPALIGYDVFNETMFRSFDPYTLREYRQWLREKYGHIETLNRVWERTYSDFDQIGFERWGWMSIMPEADYAMFRKAAVARFVKPWCDAIRQVDDRHMLLADNIHSMLAPCCHYERPQDDYGLKEAVGEIGMSFYPKQVGGCMEPALRWEIFDSFYHASARQGFFLSEMQTHIQAIYNAATSVKPLELKQWCMEAYAAGAKGLIYWMWRPFTKGIQTLGRGIVDYKNRPTERFAVAQELGALLREEGPLRPVKSTVAVLYDPLTEDFQRVYTRNYKVDDNLYLLSVFGAYKAFWENNVRCDITRFGGLADYRAVVLTNQLVMDHARAETLRAYVKNGGTLIIDGKFGLVDAFSAANKSIPGGEMNDLLGLDYLDSDQEDASFCYRGIVLTGALGRDKTLVTDASVEAVFPDQNAAVIRRAYGKGQIILFNTSVFYGFGKGECPAAVSLARVLAEEVNAVTVRSESLKLRVCQGKNGYLVFGFNYTDRDYEGEISVMLGGREVSLFFSVPANDVAVLRVGDGA